MKERYFLDSNIIMYAIGGSHPLKVPCVGVIQRIQERRLAVVTNTEVLQEILYRYRAIDQPDLAAETTRVVMEIVEEVLSVTVDDIHFAMELLHAKNIMNVRDAIHCATMVRNKIRSILSADRHFDQFDRIRRIDPRKFDAPQ